MKTLKIIILLLISGLAISTSKANQFCLAKTKCQPPDSIYTQLINLDFEAYLNKPIDSFIAVIPQGYTSMKIYPKGSPNHAGYMVIKYPNKVELTFYVHRYLFMTPEDPTHVWSVTLFRKENLTSVWMHYEGLGVKEAVDP